MPVTPTGRLSLPLEIARYMVAGSSSFQTWTGTGSQGAALARVFAPQAPSGSTKPFVIVDYARAYSRRRSSGEVDSNFFEGEGVISLLFRDAVSQAADIDALYEFLNHAGGVLADLEAAAGVVQTGVGTLQVDEIRLSKGPWRPEEDERATIGDFYELELELAFRAPSP